jgi:hypothetical protein
MARHEENPGTLREIHLARSREEPLPNDVSVRSRPCAAIVIAAASHKPIGGSCARLRAAGANVKDK